MNNHSNDPGDGKSAVEVNFNSNENGSGGFHDEHLFQLMVESAAEYAIFAVDETGIIINWNAGAERIFGYAETEIVGRNFSVLFTEEARANGVPARELQTALEKGAAKDDCCLVKSSGEKFWASGRLMALREDGGARRGGFVKIVRDQTDRKLAEENLNSYQLRFREIIRQSPLSTFVQDASGKVKYVNEAFTKLWGLTVEDLAEYNSLEDENAETLGIKSYIERAFAGEVVEIPPIFYDPKKTAAVGGGNACWIKTFAYPIKDNAGRVIEIVTMHEDVSEKMRTEKELTLNRQRLAIAQQVGKAGSFDWNIRDDINVWSPELEQLFGIEPGEFEQNLEGWRKRVASPDAEAVLNKFREAFESHKNEVEDEFRIILPDGSTRWLQSRSRIEYDEENQPRRAVGICLDITDRKRSEEALRVSRERFEALVTATAQIFWATDPSGAVNEDSLSWRRFTGQSFEEWIGFGWLDAVHPDDRDKANRVWQEAVKNQSFYEVEYRIKSADGVYRWTEARGVPVKNADGTIREWVGMNTDISERREAEEALRRSEEKYRTLFETIDEGFCLIEVMMDEAGRAVDYRFLEVNHVFEQQTGLVNAEGKTVLDLIPNIEPWWIETYGKVAVTGESVRFENSSDAMQRWFDVYASRVGGEASSIVAIVFKDITARKRQESQLAFLSEFSQELIALPMTSKLINAFGEKISRLMNASICAFVEIDEAKNEAVINHEWRREKGCSLIGAYDLPQFFTAEFLKELSVGKASVVSDIATDPRIETREKFTAMNIGAFINVPLVAGGEWKFVLCVYHDRPYDWQPDEIALMIEATNRIWTKIERTRAEDALRESHARREFVLESAKIGEWELNLATGKAKRTFIHDQCFGATEPFTDWSYDIFLSYVHPNDRAEVKRKFDESIGERKEWNFECRVVWADQSVHWIRAQGNFYCDADSGEPTRMLGIITEITEQKQAEEALRASEEFNRSVIASSPDCFKILDIEGRLQFMNDDGFCLMEIDDFDQFKGLTWVDFWENEARALAVEAVEAAKRGEVGKFQGFCRTAKGTPKWWDVVVAPVRGARGEIVRLLSISRDITANKYAEVEREELISRELNALKQSELERQKLESLFKQAPALINILRGENHVFELVHPTMYGLVGERDLEGNPAREVLPELVGQGYFEILDNVYKSGETYTENEKYALLFNPDGTQREGYFDLIYQAWRKVSGEVGGVMSFAVEVTDRVVARQAMEKAAAEREAMLEREQKLRETAEEASRLKDEFLAMVSHELRTPLNSILGWSQMMRSGVVKADQYEKAIETIDRNARSQGQLIDDLLDITRIITGKLRLNIEEVNFASIINSAMQTVRPAAQAKNIQLLVEVPIVEPQILGDAERLQQIVWNLLSNAVKFTPRGGQISVILESKGSHIKLIVRDSGEGIQPEFLPYVFDRFSQADMSSTRRMGGLGLGLSIVRHLIEMHGGTISVFSEGKGLGATFTAFLPLSPAHRQDSSPEIARGNKYPDSAGHAPTTRLDGLNILVVDDEPDACEVLGVLLEQCGARVTIANSAAEALLLINERVPDVLVSDIAMPDEDGYQLIKKIRSLPKDAGGAIPAIALTAYASPADRKKALESGFQSHITKPIDQNALVTILASLV